MNILSRYEAAFHGREIEQGPVRKVRAVCLGCHLLRKCSGKRSKLQVEAHWLSNQRSRLAGLGVFCGHREAGKLCRQSESKRQNSALGADCQDGASCSGDRGNGCLASKPPLWWSGVLRQRARTHSTHVCAVEENKPQEAEAPALTESLCPDTESLISVGRNF